MVGVTRQLPSTVVLPLISYEVERSYIYVNKMWGSQLQDICIYLMYSESMVSLYKV